MPTKETLSRALIVLLLCFLLLGCATAEEALPQMTTVTFPAESTAALPENPKEHYPPNELGFGGDSLSYHDASMDIRLHRIRAYDTPIVVAFVQLANPGQIKTEQARPYPSKATLRADEISKRVKAVLSVNADWFTYHNTGIVYRNGVLLRNRSDNSFDGLAIDIHGDFHIVRPMTEENYAKLTTPIAHSFAFGPALVIDGEIQENPDRKVTYKQRMAIGQIAPLCYVLAATDGPDQKDSAGLSMTQLAELMHGLGAHTAYNLDGGQSTTMMLHQTKLNGQNSKRFRAVGDILYFITAIPGGAAAQ